MTAALPLVLTVFVACAVEAIEALTIVLAAGLTREWRSTFQGMAAALIVLAAWNDEYEEIVDRCEDFLRQVQKEYTDNHFTYAELEENEVDLVKLRNWFAKVRERDAFDADGRQAAEKALEGCEQSLEAYAARVYAEEAESR